MEQLSFKLLVFEGPLDLLLQLIGKNKVSIYDIPISEITTQYFEVLSQMEQLDMEISSEFITMAAQLLYIKSRLLLPREEEDEDDPRDDLANRLLEYQKYKNTLPYFKEHEFSDKYLYFKAADDIKPKIEIVDKNFDIAELTEAFLDILERAKRREPPPRKNFEGIVKRDVVSVKDKISDIMSGIAKKGKLSFKKLFSAMEYKDEMVAAFLAILELIKDGIILATNSKDGGDFEIKSAENGEDFNE